MNATFLNIQAHSSGKFRELVLDIGKSHRPAFFILEFLENACSNGVLRFLGNVAQALEGAVQ